MNRMKDEFLTCSCYCEGLRVTYDPDDKEFYVCLWGTRSGYQVSWLQRLKSCWKILKTGEPFGDQVLMNQEEATKLVNFLHNNIR